MRLFGSTTPKMPRPPLKQNEIKEAEKNVETLKPGF
jgi:hypothetical protein